MKCPPWALGLAAAALVAAAGAAQAQHSNSPKNPPASAAQRPAPATAASEPRTPSGDTHVHRFFQAWGRGMDKAGAALERVPKPDERWPGTADKRSHTPGGSHEISR